MHRSYLILKTLKDLDYGCGSNNLIGIIYGSKNKKINDKMRKLKTFGIIKKHPDDNLSEIVRKIQYLGLIEEKKASGFATFLTITELGKQLGSTLAITEITIINWTSWF